MVDIGTLAEVFWGNININVDDAIVKSDCNIDIAGSAECVERFQQGRCPAGNGGDCANWRCEEVIKKLSL